MCNDHALIAVVDDEAAVRTMLQRALRMAGYEVATFASGEAFLATLGTRAPACAVVDVHMPGLSGFETERRMRVAGAGVPVVFITASDDETLEHSAADAGAVCLLHKPFSMAVLLAALGNAVKRRDGPA